jgi:hypothetical protein
MGIISVQSRSILPRPEEQSRTCGCPSGNVEDQPQCPGLYHLKQLQCTLPLALPFSPPSFFHTISLSPRSLVRDGQTSPHRPRLVFCLSHGSPFTTSRVSTSSAVWLSSRTETVIRTGGIEKCGIQITIVNTLGL